MFISKFSRLTAAMIYGGTFLLSVVSFFTTYFGLTILLDKPLALAGSFGLQIAMLGIAWNLMKIRDNRSAYVMVFMMTAFFSMFFSYANFDTSLKANTRANIARRGYASAARPVLNRYATAAREAAVKGTYQVDRIGTLITMEEEKGWATVVDEGSQDELLQSVIDGARLMVDSWRQNQGSDYRQGRGRGIIADYLESRRQQAEHHLQTAAAYNRLVDSLSLTYSSELPVNLQYALVNRAWVEFPTAGVEALTQAAPELPPPPDQIDFIETPTNRQQAFMLVIHDLFAFDRLTAFSVLLAVALDLIVILMSLAGSYALDDDEHVFNRVRQDAARRVREVSPDNREQFAHVLQENLDQFEKASQYGLTLQRVLHEYRDQKKNFSVTLKRDTEESGPSSSITMDESGNIKKTPPPRRKIVI